MFIDTNFEFDLIFEQIISCLFRKLKSKNGNDDNIDIGMNSKTSIDDFTGVVHATKCEVIRDDLSSLQTRSPNSNQTIRSNRDDLSFVDTQRMKKSNRKAHDYMNIDQQRPVKSSAVTLTRYRLPEAEEHDSDPYSSEASDDIRFDLISDFCFFSLCSI